MHSKKKTIKKTCQCITKKWVHVVVHFNKNKAFRLYSSCTMNIPPKAECFWVQIWRREKKLWRLECYLGISTSRKRLDCPVVWKSTRRRWFITGVGYCFFFQVLNKLFFELPMFHSTRVCVLLSIFALWILAFHNFFLWSFLYNKKFNNKIAEI